MQAAVIDEMSESQLLDHVEALAVDRRRCEVEILRAAAQHAYLHGPETLDPARTHEPGRERAVPIGGDGTPEIAEFAAAELGGRLGISSDSARGLVADALDLMHRLPQLWARVEDLEAQAYLARHVARKTRHLTSEQAAYVDGRMAEYADGRLTWTRFQARAEAMVKAADPDAAAAKEREAAEQQIAKPTRSDDNGMRGFYIRAPFATIAVFDAALERIAQILADLGDTGSRDRRRVKALLILSRPDLAAELLAAYRAWRDRLADLGDTESRDRRRVKALLILSRPDLAAELLAGYRGWRDRPADPAEASADGADSDDSETEEPHTGGRPEIDWATLLPKVDVSVHIYGGLDADGVARVEGYGSVTEAWVRDHLCPQARFSIRPVLDIPGMAPVDAYEIPDRHRRAVQIMTPADTFPFSSLLSGGHQIDHTKRFRHGRTAVGAGQSRVGNYGPMSIPHHRLKTFGRWTVKQPFPGIYVWRDPHGALYLVDQSGTRALRRAA